MVNKCDVRRADVTWIRSRSLHSNPRFGPPKVEPAEGFIVCLLGPFPQVPSKGAFGVSKFSSLFLPFFPLQAPRNCGFSCWISLKPPLLHGAWKQAAQAVRKAQSWANLLKHLFLELAPLISLPQDFFEPRRLSRAIWYGTGLVTRSF